MRFFFKCVAEAIVENGVKGLAEMVPGGKFAYDVAEGVWKKYKERRKEDEQREELAKLAQATLEEAKAEAAKVAREVAVDAADEIIDLEQYLTAIPDSVRQSLKRPEDPTGKTVPATFSLKSADDVLKLLPPRPPRFRPGDSLPGMSGWVLDRLLGAGGFGEVWYARHARMGSLSGAVKFCFGQSGQDLIHEAELINRIMAAGKHPNIVPLTHAHLEGDCPWLMFEYVGGGTLTDWIHSLTGKPPEQRLKQVTAALTQLCEAVGHFHALPVPVVHRDLKPSNILLDRNTKKLRITDFGIGSVTACETNRQESRGAGTRGGRLLTYLRGSHTPLYSSPQQRSGAEPDPRDDVHALGVIAYQMLTGHLSQGAGTDFAEDLRESGVSEGWIALLGKCLAQRVERRPRNGAALYQLMEALLEELDRRSQLAPPIVPKDLASESPPKPNRTAAQYQPSVQKEFEVTEAEVGEEAPHIDTPWTPERVAVAYGRTLWGGRIDKGTGSIETVILDFQIGYEFTENQVRQEIKRRKLVNRGAIYQHLRTLSERGFIEKTAYGWKRIK